MTDQELLAAEKAAYEKVAVTLAASPNFEPRMEVWRPLYREILARGLSPLREF
jgi:hypothetical protein